MTPASRLLPRTLRGRLIAGLVALLAVACASVGIVTYIAVRGALAREMNSQVQTASTLARNCLEGQFHENGGGDSESDGGTPPAAQGTATAGSENAANPGTGDSQPVTSISNSCPGLGEGTFVAVFARGHWYSSAVGDPDFTLSQADRGRLRQIRPSPAGPDAPPSTTLHLSGPGDTYLLTAVQDQDGVYYSGLPLAGMHDFLGDVALAEIAVFGVVLLLAGVLGTLWVRFSLRPLRRVATTASQVAELPLDSGEVSLPAGVPDTDAATETGQVGIAFNRMLGHVGSALRRRAASEARLRRFAADASHELRTPLAAIRGYAELALLHPGESPETVTHALGRVLSESKRMSVLVDDLLLLARLDAGRPLDREPVDMTRLAIEATSDAQVARPSHRWQLELPDDSVLVRGDAHRLHQVLANLLSNAGRHTPEGSTVTVRVSDTLPSTPPAAGQGTAATSVSRGTLPAAPRLVLTVTDNGPGIPVDLLPELFERFTRADTSRSHAINASSTGLGLAIVDAVVAAHQGSVQVTSVPGMTRFTIVLPRLAEAHLAGERPPLTPAS